MAIRLSANLRPQTFKELRKYKVPFFLNDKEISVIFSFCSKITFMNDFPFHSVYLSQVQKPGNTRPYCPCFLKHIFTRGKD